MYLNVPKDDLECESFTVIFINSLPIFENKYCLQVYLYKFTYKIVNKQMNDDLDDILFKD